MLPLGSLFKRHNISFCFFVDDVQTYLPLKPNDSESLQPLFNCSSDLKTWLDLNFLCLNENTTEIVVLVILTGWMTVLSLWSLFSLMFGHLKKKRGI